MSVYPKPPSNGTIFNPVDYETPADPNDDLIDDNNVDDNTAEHSNFVKKSGDIMTGVLTTPQITFSNDNSHQITAFTSTMNQNININTSKLANTTTSGDTTTINKLETDQITFANAETFDGGDKIQINTNTLNIANTNNMLNLVEVDVGLNAQSIDLNTNNIQANTNNIQTNTNSIQVNTNKLVNVIENPNDFDVDGDIIARGKFVSTNADIQLINSLGMTTHGLSINGETQNAAFTDSRKNVTDSFSTTSSAVFIDRSLFFQNSSGINMGYIGGGGTSLSMVIHGSNPFIINPDTGHIQHYCSVTTFGDNNGPGILKLYNQGTNTGEIHINNEIQKHAFTDEDHTKLANLVDQSPAIQNNADAISTLDTHVTNLHNQGISNLFMISLNNHDLTNAGSKFSNGNVYAYTHNYNIGYILYHTYGMTNDFYTDGTWRSNSTWEVSANIAFIGHTSYIHQLNTGFRNLHNNDLNIESDTTSSLIDGGMSTSGTGSSLYKTFRYNTGTNYIKSISGGSHLYGNYKFYLRTIYDITTANSGDIYMKGQLNIRKLDNI